MRPMCPICLNRVRELFTVKKLQKATASFLALIMLAMPAMADVVGVPGNAGNIVTNGNVTDITGGFVHGQNTINHFDQFGVANGHTVNQHFNTNNAVNLVNSRISIDGIYNAMKNGSVGGNVMFISPLGMAVGASGVLNVGSMQAIVPTQAAFNNMTNAFNTMTSLAAAQGRTQDANYQTSLDHIDGFADIDSTALDAATIAIQDKSNISNTSGQNGTVRIDGKISASGLVQISANQIEFGALADAAQANIKNTLGSVNLIANTGDIVGSNSLNIDASGNVSLESVSGNVGGTGKVVGTNSNGTVTAKANNGNVYLASHGKNVTFDNVSAKNDVNLSTVTSGKLTTTGSTTGKNITLTSAANVETGNITATGGDVTITSQTGMSQSAGTKISSTNKTKITNAVSGSVNIKNLEAGSVEITNSNGDVMLDASTGLALNSLGTTSIIAKTISQTGSNAGINSISDITLNAGGSIGNGNKLILGSNGNINVTTTAAGNVNLGALTGTVNLGTVNINNGDFSFAGNSGKNVTLNIKDNLSAKSVTLSDLNAINQTSGKTISSTAGNVSLNRINTANLYDVTAVGGNIIADTITTLTSNGTLTGQNVTLSNLGTAVLNDITANGSAGAVNVASTGSVTLNKTILGKSVTFNTGDIIAGTANALINSDAISLTSTGSIGDSTNNLNVLSTGAIKAKSTGTNKNIYLSSTGSAIFDGIQADKIVSLKTTGASSTLTTTGTTKGNSVILNSGSTLTAGQTESTGTIDITASGGISQTAGTKISSTGKTSVTNTTNGNVNIKNLDAGSVEITNTVGDVILDASANTAVTSGGTTTVIAKNISQTGANNAINSTSDISLTAAGNIGSGNKLILASNGNVNVTTTAAGDVSLGANSGTINLNNVSISNGSFSFAGNSGKNVTLNVKDNLNAKSITLSDLNALNQTNGKTVSSTAGNVSLNRINTANLYDVTAVGGNVVADTITSLTSNGTLSGQDVTLSNLGSAVLNNVTANGSTGAVNVSSTGNVTLNKTIQGKSVTFNTGSIIAAGANALINSDAIILNSTGSIGNNTNSLNVLSNNAINAKSTGAGANIYLASTGSATFNDIQAANIVNLKTTGISSALTTTGNLTGADITLDSASVLTTGQINSSGALTLKSAGGISQTSGTSLYAAGAASVTNTGNANVTISNLDAGSVNIQNNNGGVILDATANKAVTSRGVTSITAKTISQNGTYTGIDSTSNITLNTEGSIGSGNKILVATNGKVNVATTGSGDVNLGALSGTINLGPVSIFDGIFTFSGDTAKSVTLNVTDTVSANSVTLSDLNSLNQSSGKTITSTTGDITLNRINTAALQGITAGNNLIADTITTLTANGSLTGKNVTLSNLGSATLNDVTANGPSGAVNVTSTGNVTLNKTILGKSVTFNTGNIIAGTANALINSEAIDITSTGSIGDSSKNLNVLSANAIKAKSTGANSNIYLASTGSAIFDSVQASNIVSLKTTGASSNLTTTGLTKGASVTLNSGAGVTLGNVETTSGALSVTAKKGITQSVGTLLDVNGKLTLTNAAGGSGDIVIVNAKAANADIVNNSGNAIFNGLLTATGGTVNVTANAITTTVAEAINAGTIALTAKTGSIGTNGNKFGVTASNTATAAASNGDVYLTSANNIIFNNITAKNIANLTTTGTASLTTTGTVSGSSVNIDSASNAVVGNVTSKGTLEITAKTGISQTASTVLTSDGKATLTNTSGDVVLSNLTGNGIEITNGGDVKLNTASALSTALTSKGTTVINGNNIIQTGLGRAVDSTGSITMTAVGDIKNTDSSSAFLIKSPASVNASSTGGGEIVLGSLSGDTITLGDIDTDSKFTYKGGKVIVDGDISAVGVELSGLDSFVQNSGTTIDGTTGDVLISSTGNAILDGLVKATNGKVTVESANGNITSSSSVAIEAANIVLTSIRGTIGTDSNAINIKASNGLEAQALNNININSVGTDLAVNKAQSDNGNIKLSASGAASDITLNSIKADNGNITVTNDTDGLVTVNTNIDVKANKKLDITANGTGSGIVIAAGKTITNNGSVNLTNKGSQGTSVSGTIDNANVLNITNDSGSLSIIGELINSKNTVLNNSGSGILISGTLTNKAGGTFIANNSNGDLSLTAPSTVNNSGKITLNNLTGSANLNILSTNINNLTTDSVFEAINGTENTPGSGNLNFGSNADISNQGTLNLINNKGQFILAGNIDMLAGSINSFTDSTANDFKISSNITNNGNNISFNQTGTGNLILESGTVITNNSVGGQKGVINLNNSGAGNIELKNGSGIINNTDSTVNITNNAAGGDININGSITATDANQTNNAVNIINSGKDININTNTSISYISDLLIQNTTASTGNLNLNGQLTDNVNVILQNLNEANTGINIAGNTLTTKGLLKIENHGLDGLTIGSGFDITSGGGIELINDNKGSKGIIIDGTLTNNENISIADAQNNPQAGHGIIIKNNETNQGVANAGIKISGTITSNAGKNQIINYASAAGSELNLTSSGVINTNSGILLENYSSTGITLDGKINNTVKADNPNVKGDIHIIAHNSDLNIEHKANINDVYFNNQNGGIIMEVKGSGNILHTGDTTAGSIGLVATGDIHLNTEQGNVGAYDSVIDNARENGFAGLDDALSINVKTDGTISTNAKNNGNAVVNIRSYDNNGNLNIGNISSDNIAIIPSMSGSINGGTVNAKDAYLYSGKADDGTINISNVIISGLLRAEADGDISINSANAGQKLDVDFILSKKGSINLNVNGNLNVKSITAPERITVKSNGSVQHFDDLGKFDVLRAKDIYPKELYLTNIRNGGLIDIWNAYVREKVVLRADNIHANETITNGVSDDRGFHSANLDGQLVTFDIQGYTDKQNPPPIALPEWMNPNYHPSNADRTVRDLKLTIGKPVEGTGAPLGAYFEKVFADNAYINAINDVIAADMRFDVIAINKKGRIQNNKYTVDVNNVDTNYDYGVDATLYTKLTGPFILYMNDQLIVKTSAPIVTYNPNRIFNIPQTENSFQRLTNKSNRIEESTTLESFRDSRKNTRSAKNRKDIRWTIAGEGKILGSSSSESGASIKDILDISKGGMLVATDNTLRRGELLNVNFVYRGIPFEVKGEVVRVDNDNTAGVKFVNMDRFTSNVILYMSMMTENL